MTAHQFGPNRALAVLWLALTLVAAGAAIATTDAPGRLLAGGAAIVLAAYGIVGLVFWPRLSVGPEPHASRSTAKRFLLLQLKSRSCASKATSDRWQRRSRR